MKNLFDVEQLTQFEFGAIVLTVLIAGLIFGCLIAWGLLNRKNNPRAVAAAKIQQEFEEYKEKVDEHFNQTSEMFKDVTTQYKKLYDHMAVGAIELSNADTITMPRLEMQDTEEESDNTIDEPEIDQTNTVVEQESINQDTTENDEIAEQKSVESTEETVEEKSAESTEETVEEKSAESTEETVEEKSAESTEETVEEKSAESAEETVEELTKNPKPENNKPG